MIASRTACVGLLCSLFAWLPCVASVWVVGNTADDGSLGTLRHALAHAADGDAIDFETSGTIALTSGELEVTNDVTINAGSEVVTVDGQGASRVFRIAAGTTVAISGVTIANGHAGVYGGGIHSAGMLTLIGCTLSNNWATMGGGGVYTQGTPEAPVTLSITGCTLIANGAGITEEYCGGGAVALVAVEHDSAGPRADRLTIENSLLTNNTAPYGGAIVIDVNGGTGYMGWEDAHTLVTVRNSTFSSNVATAPDTQSYGGAIAMLDLGGNAGQVALSNCTLRGNAASDSGGAIANIGVLTMTDCTLDGNSAVNAGGAICNGLSWAAADATATLTGCDLTGNSVSGDGRGGAIYNGSLGGYTEESRSISSLAIAESTVSGNTAFRGGAIANAALGDDAG